MAIAMAATLLASGCTNGPDYTPIGDGLKAIGICIVVYGVVDALADLTKGGSQEPNPPPPPPPSPQRPRSRRTEGEEP